MVLLPSTGLVARFISLKFKIHVHANSVTALCFSSSVPSGSLIFILLSSVAVFASTEVLMEFS